MTNPFMELERVARSAVPGISIVHEPPLLPTGNYDLELRWDDCFVVVRWRADLGFVIADARDDDDGVFDSCPFVRVSTLQEAIATLLQVLKPGNTSALARSST